MELITAEIRETLLKNGAARNAGESLDPLPVVKLFTPDAGGTWLLTELDPEDDDLAYGLCDPGLGCPELGPVRISEILEVRGPCGLKIERDLFFRPQHTLSGYARLAAAEGAINA